MGGHSELNIVKRHGHYSELYNYIRVKAGIRSMVREYVLPGAAR
jgi:hypothetical protein